jgi:hypothetical protein
MTRPAAAYVLAPEFDTFLFAPIGEERNGMLLSVISALARLDVDPWQEAAKLAQLPEKTATERLASMITSLPEGASTHQDPLTIAARLIALLPRSAPSDVRSRTTVRTLGSAINFRTVISLIAINAIFVAFLFGAQSMLANHQLAAQTDKDTTPITGSASP